MTTSASVTPIRTFLAGIAGSRGLRAALVSGSGADSGRVDRILDRCIDSGVLVVQLELHPEVSVRLPPALADSPCRRLVDDITLKESRQALRSLAVALRRFGRLHPILLVVDELHMISSPILEEFAFFLSSLSDETLSILCRSSSIDPAVRCLVERYLIEEITVQRSIEPRHRPPLGTGETSSNAETSANAATSGPSIGVSMLGTIAIGRCAGKPAPVRGNRLSTVLGVLVIDQLLTTPLSHREFCRLASGNVDDPVRAQKIMNMGVGRLQEMLGRDAIVRTGETPKLDLAVVSVDLLDAVRLLREAVAAATGGPLMRAVDLLRCALDIVERGELFPGLEGEMFVAAREDFRGTLGRTLVEVSRLFPEEGERAGIDALLDRAVRILPEGEIVALMEERPALF